MKKKNSRKKRKTPCLYSSSSSQWTPYLFFIVLIGLASGVGNIGHTYIPELLMDSGLPVHIASTVVAISVVVEAPLIFFSDRFMDHWPYGF